MQNGAWIPDGSRSPKRRREKLGQNLDLARVYVEGDRIVERWISRGTHEGDFMGIPATHRSVTVEGMDISRFADGKLVEHWTQMDAMAMMQQLGVIPQEQEASA